MVLCNADARLFIPDGADPAIALARTTDLCITAHHDDIEINAYAPIIECRSREDRWFTGVTVTDGAGSPRGGLYEWCTDEEMKRLRMEEQKQAAAIGRYSAQFMLSYSVPEVKASGNAALVNELERIILNCSPQSLFTHNLADAHDTHVATALNVIRALKQIPAGKRPGRVIALECWRSLDWLCDEDKVLLDTGASPNISAALIGVHDSQVSGGKRYDLAALGRRRANATFLCSHEVDKHDSLSIGLDITELIEADQDPAEFIGRHIDKFKADVTARIAKHRGVEPRRF